MQCISQPWPWTPRPLPSLYKASSTLARQGKTLMFLIHLPQMMRHGTAGERSNFSATVETSRFCLNTRISITLMHHPGLESRFFIIITSAVRFSCNTVAQDTPAHTITTNRGATMTFRQSMTAAGQELKTSALHATAATSWQLSGKE